MASHRVILYGGPHDRVHADLPYLPERISIKGPDDVTTFYGRVDDPDTGAPLGAYVWEGAPHEIRAVTPTR